MLTLLARALHPRLAVLVDDEPPVDVPSALSDAQKEEVLVNAERELMELQQLIGVMHKKGFKDTPDYQELVALYAQLSRTINEAIRTNSMAAVLAPALAARGVRMQTGNVPKRLTQSIKENLPPFTSALGPATVRGRVSIGPEVENLQKVLNWDRISVSIDGVYSADTMTAVKSLQKKYGLPINGLVGAETRKLLNVLIGKG